MIGPPSSSLSSSWKSGYELEKPMNQINLNHLQYFYVFAQHKSVTKAALELGISQPSLSLQLKNFEAEVGKRLFLRNGKSFDLTPTGHRLFQRSQALFNIADEIDFSLKTKRPGHYLEYRIGITNEIERPFFAAVIGKLLNTKQADKHKFVVTSKDHQQLVGDLKKGNLDLLVTTTRIADHEPTSEFLFPVFLVTSKDHKDKKIHDFSLPGILNELQEGLVAPTEDLKLRSEMESLMDSVRAKPHVVFESNILACMVRAIKEGIGCGFLPLPYIWQEYQEGLVKALGPKEGYWKHRISFYESPHGGNGISKLLTQFVSTYTN